MVCWDGLFLLGTQRVNCKRAIIVGPWTYGYRRPWSVCSSRCYAGKAPFSVLSPLTGSRQAAWSTGIGLFLLGTQKANCKRAITGTAAALPPLPFCSIWDLTAVVSTCVFCTVARTGVYATLLLHAPSWNKTEFGSSNPWVHGVHVFTIKMSHSLHGHI